MALQEAFNWHDGEDQMHHLLKIPDRDNPTSPFLAPYAAQMLQHSPLLAIGTLDSSGRPWTSLWGGEMGFSRAIGQSIIGVKTLVGRFQDPVVEALVGTEGDGEVVKSEGPGKMVGALGIDLESRNRVKLYGRMVAGALSATEDGVGEVQLVVNIEQSLGNCPKYLNKKHIVPRIPQPKLISNSLPLPKAAVDLLEKADLFFISSSNRELDMDTNNRGGPPGFTRLLSNDENGCVLIYPEYSGNRLYQTLGNLSTTPQAGLVFPDFDTGDVLYITGTTEILIGKDASLLMPRINLAVKITVQAARFVENGLPFCGHPGEPSPYIPPVRLLEKEQGHALPRGEKQIRAKLIAKQILSPTIARFRFHITEPEKESRWKPGQYVALSFQDELDIGYSHMRDSDPQSLNDDYLRTFTISSSPGELSENDQFEITIRKLGPVTTHLFRHNTRTDLEVPIAGFGGDFFLQQEAGESIGFVAGGVGITPLLAQASNLDMKRLQLFWTVRVEDLGLVLDTFARIPELIKSTRVFATGKVNAKAESAVKQLELLEAVMLKRRVGAEDLQKFEDVKKWYICTGPSLRKTLLEWLKGLTVLYEDFNY